MSVEEVARYLGISRDTVYAWVNRQSMPARRVGRQWKFKKVAVDAWVDDGGAARVAAPIPVHATAVGDEST